MQHAGQSGGGRKRTRDDGADTNVSHKKQKLTAKDDAKAYYRMDKISEKRIEKFNSTVIVYTRTILLTGNIVVTAIDILSTQHVLQCTSRIMILEHPLVVCIINVENADKQLICGSIRNLTCVMKHTVKPAKNLWKKITKCDHCGKNELVFKGEQTTQQFCQWLFSEENVSATVICHNFKGYDSYPILQYLHDNAILPEVITNGTKFMSIKVPVCKIRFIDSINFIPMALADMAKAFGISELAKGYFPHLFNREENQTKTLTELPDLKYYTPDGMKIDKRLEFLAWYDIHKNDAFDFQYELLKYCRSDVDILRKCCLKIREIFLSTKVLALFQHTGTDLAHQKDVYIQHGRNVGEKQIGPYKVDGYYETEEGEKVVLEMNGCFWHGCNRCFKSNAINSMNDMTLGDLFTRTMDKQQYIESLGYTYVSKWECDFKKKIQDVPGLQEFIKSVNIVTPLEPRDALFRLHQTTEYGNCWSLDNDKFKAMSPGPDGAAQNI
ncbi:hypothetical protein MAR_036696 [Mya arenaria]|uniref:DNA-directed DNA polymerase n=1 Tax=Mya arenaria TaxID=6604 RepID=A0ABY7FN60_MYAAR|nr:hypothetical protein MAR_036696 [Mya arenaria]